MDLNDLLHRHQLSVMLAEAAASSAARHAHRGLVAGYAGRIAALQRSLGSTFATVPA